MKVHYMACAGSSSLDAKTSKLSLFHVMDEIGAQTFPAQVPSFCVAALFEREGDDEPMQHYQLTITLDDQLLASFAMAVDFARSRRNRSVNTIKGLSIPSPGTLVMSIMQKTTALPCWTMLAVQLGEAVDRPIPAAKPQPNEVQPPSPKVGPTIN